MDEGDVEKLKQRLKELRTQTGSIKKELNALNKEKESWFSKRSELNKQISGLINGVKGSKEERNEITGQVQDMKKERDELNKEIATKREELKELRKDYDAVVKKHNIQEDPSAIRKRIERLDYVMQTQPMSFNKEQKMMKEIENQGMKLDKFNKIARQMQQGGEPKDVSEEEMKTFKSISQEIQGIQMETQQKVNKIISDEGMSPAKYQEMIQAYSSNPEIKKKVDEKLGQQQQQ